MPRYAIMISVALLSFVAAPGAAVADCPSEPVPFAKLMYAALAQEYESCTVTVDVRFVAAGQTEGWNFAAIPPDAMAGRVAMRVLAPASVDPATGVFGFVHPHVFVDKSAADLVFDLKCGELVTLTGHPVIGRISTPGAADFVQIIFVAESLVRFAPAVDSMAEGPTGTSSSIK